MNSPLLDPFLQETILFQGLPPDQLREVAKVALVQSCNKGEILFAQGDPGRGFFVVKQGRIKVFKVSVSGKEQILHIFTPRDHFAEVPALDGNPFPASAMALEKSELVFFPRQAFLDLLEQQPALAINLLKSFARHLRRFSHLIDALTLREVPERLADYLLSLQSSPSDPNTIPTVELDLPKGQLAAKLGTIPETLSRVLAKLSREGLIAVHGSEVQLLDRDLLKLLALGKTSK
jgi:CRP/FNR family transcriptional regulator